MRDLPQVVTERREVEWIEEVEVAPGQHEVVEKIQNLEGAIQASPAEWQLRLCVAQAYVSNGQFSAAEAHLRVCRELVSDPAVTAGVFFNLGVCLENLDRWREAAAAYQQCLFFMPNLFWAHYNLGTCWMRLEDWAQAVTAFRRALSLDDCCPQAFHALRDALLAAGMTGAAFAACAPGRADAEAGWGAGQPRVH